MSTATATKRPRGRPARPAPPSTAATPQAINGHESYTIREFCRRIAVGQWALRNLRRRGLRVIRICGRAYIRGSDWLVFLESVAADEAS